MSRALPSCALLAACALAACTQLIESGNATYDDTSRSSAMFVIEASSSRDGDNFGTEVVLEGDQLIVAAPTAELTTVSSGSETCGRTIDAVDAGRIYAFELSEDDWSEAGELKRGRAADGEGLLVSTALLTLPRISMARAGRMMVVGIPAAALNDCQGTEMGTATTGAMLRQAGKVFVFELDDEEQWRVSAELAAPEPVEDQVFGTNLAIRGDLLFIAAPGDDGEQLDQSGAVYVFARDGDTFRVQQRLAPSNPIASAQFGSALSVDGDTLAVGAWFDSHGDRGVNELSEAEQVPGSGAAYVFRERDGRWEQEAYIKAPNRGADDLFGVSIALAGDRLFVGAPYEAGSHPTTRIQSDDDLEDFDRDDAPGAGAVYAFARAPDGWRFDSYLKAFEPRASAGFGIAMSLDDGQLLVGAPNEGATDQATGKALANVGAAYVYERSEDAFVPVTSFHPDVPRREAYFGFAVDLEGDVAAVGAPETTNGKGFVSVFDLRDVP